MLRPAERSGKAATELLGDRAVGLDESLGLDAVDRHVTGRLDRGETGGLGLLLESFNFRRMLRRTWT